VISPQEVDYSLAILLPRTTCQRIIKSTITISHYDNIVGNGSTNISHNGVVAHGNIKGHGLSNEKNAYFDNV